MSGVGVAMKRVAGQRWCSTTEPELGLGVLLEDLGKKGRFAFPALDEERIYTWETAPLVRVAFHEGDEILLEDGSLQTVELVREEKGLLVYELAAFEVGEGDLAAEMTFSRPQERLQTRQVDDPKEFALRVESLEWQKKIQQSEARGLTGARVGLIPHQLGIAAEVASRTSPRVLLADEVGLGKTIEACLVMHRLMMMGRVSRVLVVVPEPLVHQWFVELLRRFNLVFTIVNAEFCKGVPDGEVFSQKELNLCAMSLFKERPELMADVLSSPWDCLIVDEAHHLEWSPEEASPNYELVEALAEDAGSVLLLTATPEQLGKAGHFGRLRLLDPERYSDLAAYLEEMERYEKVAELVEEVGKEDSEAVAGPDWLPGRVRDGLAALKKGEAAGREDVVRDLLDSFGPGRVLFRNTRKVLGGFPERRAHLVELTGKDSWQAKVKWLLAFLEEFADEKVLLIMRLKEDVERLAKDLKAQRDVNLAVFHEDLSLLQRDRNAAWFSEEDGAQVLLCSEVGSEGRNFQFSRRLVLLDLPENPELLEQRIGRLDRIGQTGTIEIYVPFLSGGGEERWAQWYHEGLDSFEHSLPDARGVLQRLPDNWREDPLRYLEETKAARKELLEQTTKGRDRLLALTSKLRGEADPVRKEIEKWDENVAFEQWVVALWEQLGAKVERAGRRSYVLGSTHLEVDLFPELKVEKITVTFDRAEALQREDWQFASIDHPLVRRAMEAVLTGEKGNCSFGFWPSEEEGKAILAEGYFMVECLVPAELQIARYLPPTPVRVAVNHKGEGRTEDAALANAKIVSGPHERILDQPKLLAELLPPMLDGLKEEAKKAQAVLVKKAQAAFEKEAERELSRLETLKELNPAVTDEEIAELKSHHEEVRKALTIARPRFDSLRMVYRLPAKT